MFSRCFGKTRRVLFLSTQKLIIYDAREDGEAWAHDDAWDHAGADHGAYAWADAVAGSNDGEQAAVLLP